MNKMKEVTNVKEQYKTDVKLNIRINLHKKYSINQEGFGNWIFRNLPDFSNKKILELGCGSGELWKNRSDEISKINSVIFNDISEGMINSAMENIGTYPNVEYRVFNAEKIPFDNCSFDYVIANHMLYHVPDLGKTLSEIHRVLIPGGKLYATTFGENGILKYVNSILGTDENHNLITSSFTLQNGKQSLDKYFKNVSCIEYEDGLLITDEKDLVDYIFSMSSILDDCRYSEEQLLHKLKTIRDNNNGVIEIPKEAGMFMAVK